MNPTTEQQDIFAVLRARVDALEARLDELVATRKARKWETPWPRTSKLTQGTRDEAPALIGSARGEHPGHRNQQGDVR